MASLITATMVNRYKIAVGAFSTTCSIYNIIRQNPIGFRRALRKVGEEIMTCDYLRRLVAEYEEANKDVDNCGALCLVLVELRRAGHSDIAMYLAKCDYKQALARIDELEKESWRNEKGC